MNTNQHTNKIAQSYSLGSGSEEAFWSNVQQLIENMVLDVRLEPKNQSSVTCDYVLTTKGIAIGFIVVKIPNPSIANSQGEFRSSHLTLEAIMQFAEKLGLTLVPEKDSARLNLPIGETFSPPLEVLGEVKTDRPSKPGYQTANPHAYKYVKELRDELKQKPTEAEKLMWQELRNKKTGHKIRRQHIIDNFIADFVCLRKKLVIEIDGEIHLKQKEYDAFRTSVLNALGYEVVRFTNKEVFASPANVAAKIKTILDGKPDIQNEDDTNTPPMEGQGEVRTPNTFAPIDILDYIYAVLHSPTYREKYKEFLKIDFPRVPYPKDKATFWQLVNLGSQIRQIHLLESPTVEKYITQYPVNGDNVVTKPKYQDGKVFINDTQYFANVPEVAWNFYIGGYQPAQKWLKDRKDRKLEFEDILHYQKIIVALTETDRLMKEIDMVEIE